jgi:hypothetical protein
MRHLCLSDCSEYEYSLPPPYSPRHPIMHSCAHCGYAWSKYRWYDIDESLSKEQFEPEMQKHIESEFAKHIDKSGPHWLWRYSDYWRPIIAPATFSFWLFKEPIPEGRHATQNPEVCSEDKCVNPDHLKLGET